MIAFTCPDCQQSLRAPERLSGKHAKCPRCGSLALISATEIVTVSPAPAGGAEAETIPPAAAAVPDEAATVAPGLTPAAPAAGDWPSIPGYEVVGELGRGGMGVVYQARQVGLNRLVALKMILAAGHASAADRARFRAEAEAVARLKHPGIVQVYEVGEHAGLPFFSLEFCEGGSLAAKLAGTPLPPLAAARLVEQLARAVEAAHAARVVHRDLKPANVLLGADGTPKVTDFGLAKKLDEAGQTQSGAVLGTPSYMAPEQAGGKGKLVGPLADVYALGAILYEVLTGRPPFRAASSLDTVLQVVSVEPVPVRQLQPTVPRDLETICLKCLAKEPGKRYGSAAALAEDLGRYLAGEPIRARPVGRVERLWRWSGRHPALAGSLVAAVTLALTITGKAIAVARNRADQLEQEVLRSNLYAAQGVASTVLWQLERLSDPVARLTADRQLGALLRAGDRAGLRQFLEATRRHYEDPAAGVGEPGEEPAYATWFVLDRVGQLLAVAPAPDDPTLIGRDFSRRNYFRGALRRAGGAGRATVHISRVFHAENRGLYKFALSAAVRAGHDKDAHVVGVIAATITTTRTLGSLQLNDERHTAVLVGRKDTGPPRGASPAEEGPEFLILLHPAYRRGVPAVAAPPQRFQALLRPRAGDEFQLPDLRVGLSTDQAMEAHYADPAAVRDRRFAGRWLAGFAPVGNTEFVVIVQQRYDEVIEPDRKVFLDLLVWVGVALLLGSICVAGLYAYGVRRATLRGGNS